MALPGTRVKVPPAKAAAKKVHAVKAPARATHTERTVKPLTKTGKPSGHVTSEKHKAKRTERLGPTAPIPPAPPPRLPLPVACKGESSYTTEIAAACCSRIAEGYTIRQIGEIDGYPSDRTMYSWMHKHKEFYNAYQDALVARAEVYREEIIAIADDARNDFMEKAGIGGTPYVTLDSEHVQRSKLRIDTRRWLMASMVPKKFGAKSEVAVVGDPTRPVTTAVLDSASLAKLTDAELDAALAAAEKLKPAETEEKP